MATERLSMRHTREILRQKWCSRRRDLADLALTPWVNSELAAGGAAVPGMSRRHSGWVERLKRPGQEHSRVSTEVRRTWGQAFLRSGLLPSVTVRFRYACRAARYSEHPGAKRDRPDSRSLLVGDSMPIARRQGRRRRLK
jgi:hypothetical protein